MKRKPHVAHIELLPHLRKWIVHCDQCGQVGIGQDAEIDAILIAERHTAVGGSRVMRKILAALFGLAVLATATPALAANTSNPHPGWQHNPRNPHYRPPVTTCSWVQTATIGSVPHCV